MAVQQKPLEMLYETATASPAIIPAGDESEVSDQTKRSLIEALLGVRVGRK